MTRPAPYVFCGGKVNWPRGPFDKGGDPGLRHAAEFMGGMAAVIRVRRVQRGLSQRQLAANLNMSDGTIVRLETGSGWTDTAELLRICEHLDIPLRAPAVSELP